MMTSCQVAVARPSTAASEITVVALETQHALSAPLRVRIRACAIRDTLVTAQYVSLSIPAPMDNRTAVSLQLATMHGQESTPACATSGFWATATNVSKMSVVGSQTEAAMKTPFAL